MCQNKMFGMNFLDSYYMLTKDKGANVIITLCRITMKIFNKVKFDDTKNKERIINVIKIMGEGEKIKGSVKEIIDHTYVQLLNQKVVSSSDK